MVARRSLPSNSLSDPSILVVGDRRCGFTLPLGNALSPWCGDCCTIMERALRIRAACVCSHLIPGIVDTKDGAHELLWRDVPWAFEQIVSALHLGQALGAVNSLENSCLVWGVLCLMQKDRLRRQRNRCSCLNTRCMCGRCNRGRTKLVPMLWTKTDMMIVGKMCLPMHLVFSW